MLNANSLTTNLLVTALMLALVFALPWVDRRVCGRLGLNLQGGVSAHPRAEALLRARQAILCAMFGLYLAVLAYLVFFSRSATEDYQVHVALFKDLKDAVKIDLGLLGLLRAFLRDGVSGFREHVHIVSAKDIAQVYMNMMLFVPMGYLLPYLFQWFRAHGVLRPTVTCFLVSFAIENLQLIFRRGFYDMDDLASNTLGGLLGAVLFYLVAYVVTHPGWRKEWKDYRRWQRNARTRTLYPFARRVNLSRTSLVATDEGEVWDFYVMKLGFRLIRQLVPLDTPGTDMLLAMGKMQLEIRCTNGEAAPAGQQLTISARRLGPILRRLQLNGIETAGIEQDRYTGRQCIRFHGPDGVEIEVLEG